MKKDSKSGLLRYSVFGSVVLVAQFGSHSQQAQAGMGPLVLEPSTNTAWQESDVISLEIKPGSSTVVSESMREWSSKAFLSLVPAISDVAKMKVALLKMRLLIEENFVSEDLASLSPEIQAQVYGAFFSELENYSERVALLTQLMKNAPEENVRELAHQVFVSLAKKASAYPKLFAYLKQRSMLEVASLVCDDPELVQLYGLSKTKIHT